MNMPPLAVYGCCCSNVCCVCDEVSGCGWTPVADEGLKPTLLVSFAGGAKAPPKLKNLGVSPGPLLGA